MKKGKNNDEDMSMTFISEVGQKSAIADMEENTEVVNELKEEIRKYEEKQNNKKSNTKKKKVKEPEKKEEEQIEENIKIDIDSEPDYFDEVEKKRVHPVFIFIAVILSLAAGIGATVLYYKFFKPVKKVSTPVVKEKKEEKKEFSPDSVYIKELISRYDSPINSDEDTYKSLYLDDKVKVEDFDDELIQIYAVKNLSIKKNNKFSTDDLQESLDKLFGKRNYKPSTKDIKTDSCYTYQYNKEDKTYLLKSSSKCNEEDEDFKLHRKIVKANLVDKKLTIDVAIAVENIDNEKEVKIYKTYDLEKKSGEEVEDIDINTFDIENDYSKLNQYRYTYNYDQDNNNYYLVSIELNK